MLCSGMSNYKIEYDGKENYPFDMAYFDQEKRLAEGFTMSLTESGYRNWTIVRPATTYSTGRAQLVTLEANSFVYRALENKKVIIPIQAKDCPATLSWGGDVGKMIARIVLNEKFICDKRRYSYGEGFRRKSNYFRFER